jgi:LCP family protein required for cell wall assembly
VRLIPRTRGGALLRFGAATMVVIALAAATTAVAGLLQFKQVVDEFNLSPSLKGVQVTIPPPGAAQTLLLIGSDHRAGTSYNSANTDTMLLVRLNPASKTINLLSVPRDLEVQIPGAHGSYPAKLNAAYSVGGPNLLLQILKTQVFSGFHVNHIIDINFAGFSNLIDAIGCVDADVDHRYYNSSQPGVDDYSSIDIQPGYQKLCGDNQADTGALAFVRFRHTDTDLVRNARQQDFIRWAKDAYGVSKLVANRDQLLRIFGQHAQTDSGLHSVDGLLNLFNLILNLAGTHIKQIKFPAQLQVCGQTVTVNGVAQQTPCYVTAEHQAEARVYQEFMAPTLSSPAPAPNPPGRARGGSSSHAPPAGHPSTAGLVPDPQDGRAQAQALGRAGIPVYYPTMLYDPPALGPSQYCSDLIGNCVAYGEPASAYVGSYPRQYLIHVGGRAYPSYRMTVEVNAAAGEYYGVQGTAWRTPPILAHPTQTQVLGGRTMLEFFNGSRLTLIAWRTKTAAYWVSNSLTDTIPNHQLEGIAASMTLYR